MNAAKSLLEILQMNSSYRLKIEKKSLIKKINNRLDTVEAMVNDMELELSK